MANLVDQYPALRQHLYGEDIRHLAGAQTPRHQEIRWPCFPPSPAAGNEGKRQMNQPSRPVLTRGRLRRYSRHLIMPEAGLEGQEKLKAAKTLIAGPGGLGSPGAPYLAAAGVGRLDLIASCPDPLHLAWYPVVPRWASWADCRALSVLSRPGRRSS